MPGFGWLLYGASLLAPEGGGMADHDLQPATAARFARLALDCVHREYPNKIAHVLQSDEDAGTPRALTPVFYGCFDWHSAVHGHWLLVRLARAFPAAPFASSAREALAASFTAERVAGEVAYLSVPARATFERPYGLAWLLQLSAELHEWEDPQARKWAATLEPLVDVAVRRFLSWLPKLSYPIRTGEHSQTAFAFGLILDFARSRDQRELEQLLVSRSRAFYGKDRHGPLHFEPSGQDFLSPTLAEADLMRRVLAPAEFGGWLEKFLPQLSTAAGVAALQPAVVTDKSDGKLAHLDGLNLSRAWMLEGIAAGLPAADPRRPALLESARVHAVQGVEAVREEHYEGGHWLGSFAVYLLTSRGL
jgi:hypothetical protein